MKEKQIEREVARRVLGDLEHFPVVGLLGPRQVGKTTLALELRKALDRARKGPSGSLGKSLGKSLKGKSVYLDLERPADLAKLADAELFLEEFSDALVILDEVQRKPDLFEVMRGLIDRYRRQKKAGRFLVLGSAAPELLCQSAESLAGRIAYIDLAPLGCMELLKNKSTKNFEELYEKIEQWESEQLWDGEEAVGGAIAETNCVFDWECEHIVLRRINDKSCAFTCYIMMHGEPRKDDVAFCGDTIGVIVDGTIDYDEEQKSWEINDYEVDAGVEDWRAIDAGLADRISQQWGDLIEVDAQLEDWIAIDAGLPDSISQQWGDSINPLEKLWLRGGFPDSFLAKSAAQSLRWRDAFIRTYLERDISMLGAKIEPERLRLFFTMLAHDQGSLWNANRPAKALDITGVTARHYLDLFTSLLLVRQLPAWNKNTRKRLVKSPKVYIRDSGLVHALLGLDNLNALQGHPICGVSWEGFVMEQILNALPSRWRAYHYRAAGGAELDLVLQSPRGKVLGIEIKRTLAPKLSKGFYSACEDIGAKERYCIIAGKESFPLGKKTKAVGLVGFLEFLGQLKS